MIFQDPYSSLNPRMTIEEIIKEPLVIYKIGSSESMVKRVDELLLDVSLPLHYKNRYPHELSGGERQRVSIARALISKPKLLICDEPTHALDCSVQASIINLLKDLKEKHNLSLLFISHDLCLVKNLSDRLLVMYGGFIVEEGITESIFDNPLHPFTQKLLSAIPVFGTKIKIDETDIKECEMQAPSMTLNSVTLNSCVQDLQKSITKLNSLNQNPKSPCPYLSRCPQKGAQCENFEVGVSKKDKRHKYLCHLPNHKKQK
jgi:oligopeptide transport system ATP-binding protein